MTAIFSCSRGRIAREQTTSTLPLQAAGRLATPRTRPTPRPDRDIQVTVCARARTIRTPPHAPGNEACTGPSQENPMATRTDELLSKGMGKAKAVKARLSGLVGLFGKLAEQHGQVSAMLKRVQSNVSKRAELW